ncbi:glycosyltransferase family 39 protein [Candidatus Sumerlaeota bacterium]|nr:glycosyltransferase family 39 protein [Candidatus Sumerlaeota bacterium]
MTSSFHRSGNGFLVRLVLLVLGLTLLRLLAAGAFPLLAGEAYYWLWGRHLALGYYDHPPMVAWMSALFLGWVDTSELAARSGPIVLGALTPLAIYGLARAMYPASPRLAWRAAALCAITPMFSLNAILVMPDNSLVLFTALSWWFFWRAANGRGTGAWILAGLAAGLALLSKFHAWVLLPPLWLFLAISPSKRRLLRTPGPWLAAALALALVSLNLWWNANHDWANYAFQWRRSSIPRAHLRLGQVLEFLGGAVPMVSPLVFPIMVWGVWKGFKRWRRSGDDRVLYLLCAGLPLPLFLGLLSPGVEISPHWPATGYVPLLVLAVALYENGELFGRRYWRWAVGVCVALTLLMHLAPLVAFQIRTEREDPLSRPKRWSLARLHEKLLGWREIGALGRRVRDEMNERSPAVIMAGNWHLASMLAFYSGETQEVFALDERSAGNFELWRQEQGGLEGFDAVVVIEKSKPNKQHPSYITKYDKYHRYLDPLFERVEEVPSLIVYPSGKTEEYLGYGVSPPRLREFLVFRCYGFNGELKRD